MSAPKLLWLDLETTGLSPKDDAILQIGVHFTDGRLNSLSDPLEITVWASEYDLAGMSPFVREMHTKSGLLAKVQGPDAVLFETAEHELLDFITSHIQDPKNTYLAGNSIHFDRGFLAEQMPLVLTHATHRMLDVSAFKVIAALLAPNTKLDRVPAHTALADIEGSKEELQFWARLMFNDNFRRMVQPAVVPAGTDWKQG